MRAPVRLSLLFLLALGNPGRADEIEDAAVKALKKAGCKVTRDLTVPAKPIVGVLLPDTATDDHMKLLRTLPGLQRVEIPGGAVTNDGLRELLPLKKLKVLEMTFLRGVTDDGMGTVAKLIGLERLAVNNTPVGSEGMKEVKKLKALRELSLHGTRVGDTGVAHLIELTELRSLDLGGTDITDAALLEVKKLKKLETLFLDGTEVSDAGVKHLKDAHSLVSLDLVVRNGANRLTDACLADLAGLKKLAHLRLSTSAMTADGLAKLAKAPALEELDLVVSSLLPTGFRIGQTKKEVEGLRKLFPKKCRVTADGFPN
jgi:hypothetical protein